MTTTCCDGLDTIARAYYGHDWQALMAGWDGPTIDLAQELLSNGLPTREIVTAIHRDIVERWQDLDAIDEPDRLY